MSGLSLGNANIFVTNILIIILVIMDDIMLLKEKHMKITDSQVKDLLQDKIKLIACIKIKENQRCNEDETKVKDLMLKVASLKETLQSEEQALEDKNRDLSKHLDYIAELEAEKKKFLEESHSLELQRNKLRTCKRNLHDQELLEQGRRKFSLYKELTGIKWDYERLKENVTGYVTNNKNYIHHFCYTNENTKDLNNHLWQEIHKSTFHTEDKNICDKEYVMKDK